MIIEEIIKNLPYNTPFLFVDDLVSVDENGVTGTFTFKEDLDFYKGHFVNNPITPEVILTETMAQIGLVCLEIFLVSEKIYFRFNKLKCKVKMMNEKSEIVCEGTIAGIIKIN